MLRLGGDWNNAPAPKPADQRTLYDECQALSFGILSPAEHQRMRRLTAPAFSRRVMDQIEADIRDSIATVFDEIEDPKLFDAATDIAAKIPIRAIARMVGVPADAEDVFNHGLGWNMTRASNPMFAADRDTYVQGALPGLRYLLDLIAERRRNSEYGDDFIGTLLASVVDGEHLSDMEIRSLIVSLVVAGADTAVDLHTLLIQALMRHPDQRKLLREQPDLMPAAILETLRWSGHGKFGAIPRFPLEDVELGGQVLEKGSFVMMLLAPSWLDPVKWPEPCQFDITRDHAGNIVFGALPRVFALGEDGLARVIGAADGTDAVLQDVVAECPTGALQLIRSDHTT